MRISDWSSDVCSSDLLAIDPHRIVGFGEQRGRHIEAWGVAVQQITASLVRAFAHAHIEVALIAVDLSLIDHRADLRARLERTIGRASCRERGCQYVEISVVAVSLKKKIRQKKR